VINANEALSKLITRPNKISGEVAIAKYLNVNKKRNAKISQLYIH
jgi:hypothetical protein